MCGRYSLAPEESQEIARIAAEIGRRFGPEAIHTGEIFPTNAAPILLPEGAALAPRPMTWGFPGFRGRGVIINARGETALDKPMFRRPLLERRCVVPTSGFYEWDRQKVRHRFRLPGREVLYLAGLWDTFQGEARFVILTTAPNDSVVNIHDRMPVVLTEGELTAWLLDPRQAVVKLTACQPALEQVAG